MEVTTPHKKSVRPLRRRGRDRKRSRPESRRNSFAQEYERLVDELLDGFSDEELDGAGSGVRVFFRLNSEGLPEAALVFDRETGQTVEKLRFPLAGGEAA
jgi:hypothetical protein